MRQAVRLTSLKVPNFVCVMSLTLNGLKSADGSLKGSTVFSDILPYSFITRGGRMLALPSNGLN